MGQTAIIAIGVLSVLEGARYFSPILAFGMALGGLLTASVLLFATRSTP